MTKTSKKIDDYLTKLPNWQRENLVEFRKIIHSVEPRMTEDWKWNVPFFILDGQMLFAMSAFKEHTKYNFIANGALLDDPHKLFNNGLESKKSRGLDLHEGETVDEKQLRELVEESITKIKL